MDLFGSGARWYVEPPPLTRACIYCLLVSFFGWWFSTRSRNIHWRYCVDSDGFQTSPPTEDQSHWEFGLGLLLLEGCTDSRTASSTWRECYGQSFARAEADPRIPQIAANRVNKHPNMQSVLDQQCTTWETKLRSTVIPAQDASKFVVELGNGPWQEAHKTRLSRAKMSIWRCELNWVYPDVFLMVLT